MHVVALTERDAPRYRALMLHAYEAAGDAFTSTAQEQSSKSTSKKSSKKEFHLPPLLLGK